METREMECGAFRSQAWLDEHLRELEGLERDAVVTLVESAGLQARVVNYPSGWMTQEQRVDRINLWLAPDGRVASIDAG